MACLTALQEQKIADYLLKYYAEAEFPSLRHQCAIWRESRPLAGMRVLETTPVFRNTLAKYLALSQAGAEVVISTPPALLHDSEVVGMLPELGFEVTSRAEEAGTFDLILDCGGCHAELEPRIGFVELTRSGLEKYRGSSKPVFLADAGRIKEIETCLGTGESFLRAMAHFGYPSLKGKSVVVFGYGKVGRGVVMYAGRAGASVTVVDACDKKEDMPQGVVFVHLDDVSAVRKILDRAFCVVTVTGQCHALAGRVDLLALTRSSALLVNMGVEDEYGSEVPAERVLNCKFPLNFALEEPTLMRYIETTMALDNAGAVELASAEGTLPCGIIVPSADLEEYYLDVVRREGLIGDELSRAGISA